MKTPRLAGTGPELAGAGDFTGPGAGEPAKRATCSGAGWPLATVRRARYLYTLFSVPHVRPRAGTGNTGGGSNARSGLPASGAVREHEVTSVAGE